MESLTCTRRHQSTCTCHGVPVHAIEELNKQNEAEYLGLETWVTWPTFANVGVSVINHRTSPGCWLGSEEYPSLDPTFANVGVSVINHRTLSRLLVRLGRFLRDGPMRQRPLTTLYR